MKPVEYTVLEIEKQQKTKGIVDMAKWSLRAFAAFMCWQGIVMAAETSLGLPSIGLLASGVAILALAKKVADLSFKINGEIADLKLSISYEDYKQYHKKALPVRAFDKAKTMVKSIQHSGFKS